MTSKTDMKGTTSKIDVESTFICNEQCSKVNRVHMISWFVGLLALA
jgi:hypothetical protein